MSGNEVLARERRSRSQGSGLTRETIQGRWRLDQLWSKRQTQPQIRTAALLRALQATLAITSSPEGDGLAVLNSVQVGGLQLCFSGEGQLRGRRPLLVFWFTQLEVRCGDHTLWRQAIAGPPEPRKRPFFALIAREGEGESAWLLARGRGGGLALWLLGD
ncbi:hypothetical protein H6G16_05095 [Cyanobium sp. FACHB-13342]|nr:hypothetical protein [Cyanobium sp. FACHB-13342]